MKMTKKLNFYNALFVAKSINLGLQTIKSPGTSLPGYVALKLAPNFLTHLTKYNSKDVITVTGTNGKTTTSGLLAHILKTAGNNILHNEKGANMPSGIATSLAVGYKPFSQFDYTVLECDEAYLTQLYNSINANYLLLTNLFRDQLDRYGELDTTAKKIQEAITKNPNLILITNADDPTLQELGINNQKIYYGFENIEYKTSATQSQAPAEIVTCSCKSELEYQEVYYAHIGKYFCQNCNFTRPEPNYKGTAIIYDDFSEIIVKYTKNNNLTETKFTTSLIGLYNAYNVLSAISACLELGINEEIIQKALNNYKTMFGRAEKLNINNKNILIQLIKNPTGATEVLRTINKNNCKKIFIAINDNYADGRDISWLWDTDFELLQNYGCDIVVSGIRAYDMATRLKYAGIDTNKIVIIEDIKTAFNKALNDIQENEQLLIMPSYTALLEMQKFLK